jgi:hypothetical protein
MPSTPSTFSSRRRPFATLTGAVLLQAFAHDCKPEAPGPTQFQGECTGFQIQVKAKDPGKRCLE